MIKKANLISCIMVQTVCESVVGGMEWISVSHQSSHASFTVKPLQRESYTQRCTVSWSPLSL